MNQFAELRRHAANLGREAERLWWARSLRERWILAATAGLLLFLLPYLLLWEPLMERRAQLEQQVITQHEALAWMRGAAGEIEAHGGSAPIETATDDRSLLSLVDRSARRGGLSEPLNRVQPDGAGGVRIWMDRARFDALLVWLDTLQRENGVQATAIVIEPTNEPGLVNARMTLEIAL